MTIEKDGRRAFGAEPVAVDDRIAGRFDEPHVLQSNPAHLVRAPFGAATDVALVLRQRADAWYGQIPLQFLDIAVAIQVDEVDDGWRRHGNH